MHFGRPRDADGELVEIRPGMKPRCAGRGQGALELGGAGGAQGGHVAQPMRPDRGQVDGCGQGAQGLVRADVAGGLLAADVLLAGPQGHDEGAPAVDVGRHADQAAGDLPDERLATGEDAQVRTAVRERDPERLPLPAGDVGAVGSGRRQDGQRDRLDDGDEESPGGVGQATHLGHRFEQPQEVGVGRDDARHRAFGIGQHALQGGQVGRARSRAFRDERDLVGHELGPGEVSAQRLAIVRVHAAAHQHALAAGGAAGHQGAFGRGRRAVVVRG